MFAALALAFLVVPFVELFLIIQVGSAIGAPLTIAVLLLVSVAGAALVKREGLGVLQRARAQMHRGVVPGSELIDGVLILVGGAFLLTPGFLTDFLGLALLVPPVRRLLRRWAARRLQHRVVRVERW